MEANDTRLSSVWQAIRKGMRNNNINSSRMSSMTAGFKPFYKPQPIAEGIEDGNVPITSEFLHLCVRAFRLTNARTGSQDDKLTDEDCITLLMGSLETTHQRESLF